jgi:hypothetical protein
MPGEQRTDALLPGLIDQSHRLAQRGARRFFHQHMFAGGQRLLHQCESSLRRRTKRDRIHLGAAFQQLAQRVKVLHPGTGFTLRGDRHQTKSGIGVDRRNMLILGNLAVAHQTETDRLHQ